MYRSENLAGEKGSKEPGEKVREIVGLRMVAVVAAVDRRPRVAAGNV